MTYVAEFKFTTQVDTRIARENKMFNADSENHAIGKAIAYFEDKWGEGSSSIHMKSLKVEEFSNYNPS